MLHDLAFRRENCQTTNTCSWSHTLAGLLTPDEMASVYNFGMPTTYERHVHEYRRFLNDLSLDGVLKEPASMLQLSATPQYHRNSIHPLEVLRMDRVSITPTLTWYDWMLSFMQWPTQIFVLRGVGS